MLDAAKIYKDLKDQLHELDKERMRFYKKVEPFRYTFWTIFILVGSFLLARMNISSLNGKFISEGNLAYLIGGYAITVFVTLIVFLAVSHHHREKFKELFTSKIAPYIIRGLDPSFKYDYKGQIPRMEVISSLLFPPFNTYECQDLVTGVIKNVPIKFAEIKMRKVKVQKDSKQYTQVFSGIFYRADLEVKFPTDIWLITKGNQKSIREEGKKRIKIEDPSIKSYGVYADDEQLARQVLQPFILEKIASLNQKLKKNKIIRGSLSFHFGRQWVQIAVPTRSKFMEPRLSTSIDRLSFVEEQTILLNAISSLMEDLTLK